MRTTPSSHGSPSDAGSGALALGRGPSRIGFGLDLQQIQLSAFPRCPFNVVASGLLRSLSGQGGNRAEKPGAQRRCVLRLHGALLGDHGGVSPLPTGHDPGVVAERSCDQHLTAVTEGGHPTIGRLQLGLDQHGHPDLSRLHSSDSGPLQRIRAEDGSPAADHPESHFFGTQVRIGGKRPGPDSFGLRPTR